MQFQLDQLGPGRFLAEPTFTEIGGKLVGTSTWVDRNGQRQERHTVLKIRDGKIADMQVCGSWRQAKRFANRT